MRIERAHLRPALGFGAAALAICAAGAALAGTGQPSPWQINMQTPVTQLARDAMNFHTALVWLITAICVFVLALLVYIVFKFNEKANPVPSKTTHNTTIEVLWTIVPILILVAISIPSFRLLREQLVIPNADVVVKVTGHAWYWSYEYPADQGGFRFESNLVEENLRPDQPKLLAVDNEMVVPVNKVVRVQVTAADVLHAFALPSFNLKIDAVPGRLNETWFKAEREGVYYGQCSELCGARHAYMPIAIRVVSEAQYAAWIDEAKKKFAATDAAPGVRLAAR